MIALEVKNGVVVNRVIVETAEFAVSQGWVIPPGVELVNVGWIVGEGGKFVPPGPIAPSPDEMAALRASALTTAMAYGNSITDREIGQWAGVEPLSWTQQRAEALTVVGGGTLDQFAVLPGLAEDKGIPLAGYAADVLANAARYQVVLRAAVQLRRLATAALTDEAVDTPEKLAAAVADLKAEADALAAQLIGG